MTAAGVTKSRRRRFPLDIEGLVLAHVARVGGSISGPIRSREGNRGQAYNLNLAGSDILAPDGRCSWHHCRACDTRPKTSRVFWDRKGETNMERDRRATRQRRGRGWKVIRVWQHSLKKYPNACLNRIRRGLTLS